MDKNTIDKTNSYEPGPIWPQRVPTSELPINQRNPGGPTGGACNRPCCTSGAWLDD